jgi:hypothetical protein
LRVKAAKSRLVKAMEDDMVCYDGTVNNSLIAGFRPPCQRQLAASTSKVWSIEATVDGYEIVFGLEFDIFTVTGTFYFRACAIPIYVIVVFFS